MYGATGTSAEITSLTTNFLPAPVANATQNGLNPLVYACEAAEGEFRGERTGKALRRTADAGVALTADLHRAGRGSIRLPQDSPGYLADRRR
jgi:hypothetical protein